jgi:hypothetical protein
MAYTVDQQVSSSPDTVIQSRVTSSPTHFGSEEVLGAESRGRLILISSHGRQHLEHIARAVAQSHESRLGTKEPLPHILPLVPLDPCQLRSPCFVHFVDLAVVPVAVAVVFLLDRLDGLLVDERIPHRQTRHDGNHVGQTTMLRAYR